MADFHFVSTKLKETGKKGILKPDADGYYTMLIGGLNVTNSMGDYYVAEGAKQLFEKSSVFMRRVAGGYVRGEVGHPEYHPGMTDEDYLRRLVKIDPNNVCVVFSDFWLDTEYGRKNPKLGNPDMVGIFAKFRPGGVKGAFLAQDLEDPNCNVAFSLRGYTQDWYERGRKKRILSEIYTFDYVIEPGIATSNKYDSPGLEELQEVFIPKGSMKEAIKNIKNTPGALEDASLLSSIERKLADPKELPKYLKGW